MDEQRSAEDAVGRAPQLSRTALTVLLAIIAIAPPLTILILWKLLPSPGQQELPAEVRVVEVAAESLAAPDSARFPALELRNAGQSAWTNIRVTLNDAFHFYSGDSLEPGQELVLLLHRFADRTGKPFEGDGGTVQHVQISARLPTGHQARFSERVSRPSSAGNSEPLRPGREHPQP